MARRARWPEHSDRRDRLHRAAAIVAAEPPQLVRGDLEDVLPSLIAQAPVDATLVVFHSSVLYQVVPDRRMAFVHFMRRLDRAHWDAIEAPHVLPYANLPPPPDHTALNVLALDEVPLAWTRGHGQGLIWFSDRLAGDLAGRRNGVSVGCRTIGAECRAAADPAPKPK